MFRHTIVFDLNIAIQKKMNVKIWVLCCLVSFFSAGNSRAQSEKVWAFANYSGLDFNNTPPTLIQTSIDQGILSGEAAASVCDDNGQLLFYTDGSQVWNRNHVLMSNGNDLTGFGIGVTGSTSQGTIIVPWPDSLHKYFVFSLTPFELGSNMGRLYYSVVNMNLNGGLGDVQPGQKGILMDSVLTEKMTATAGNRCNIWLIVRSAPPNPVMKSYEVNAGGLQLSPVLSPISSTGQYFIGKMEVAPDGSKIAETSHLGNNGLTLYDFDRTTGIISNDMQLMGDITTYGAAFSADNTKLYCQQSGSSSQPGQLWQFDIASGNVSIIQSSATMVAPTSANTSVKSGPDGKMYFFDGPSSIGVLQFPDLSGPAVNYTANAIPAAGHQLGLPNTLPLVKKDTLYKTFSDTAACFVAIQLSAANTTGWGYRWSTGEAGTQISVTSPGTYWLSYRTAPCVIHIDTFKVWFPATAQDIHVRSACNGSMNGYARVTDQDTLITYEYRWTRNGDTTVLSVTDSLVHAPSGNYQLEIATSTGCATVLQVYIPEETYTASFLTDTLFCTADTVRFQNTSPAYFRDWHWSFGDHTGSAAQHPYHIYNSPGYLEVRLVASGGICTDTAYHYLTIDTPMSDLSFTVDPHAICIGQAVTFNIQADSTVVDLLWAFDDESSAVRPIETVSHAYDTDGQKNIILTARFRACPDISASDSIRVYPFPLVNLGPDSVICLDGQPVLLHNYQPHFDHYQYLWSTGDTTQSISVVHHGMYDLRVTNAYGCATTERVTVDKDCYTDIPNAFTPNGDNVNDYFFPRQLLSRSVSAFHMKIFNRWGQIIFETTRPDGRGWDGKLNDKEQPVGVYVYLIEVGFTNGRTEHYNGNVTLLR